jgi:hypothetical protein
MMHYDKYVQSLFTLNEETHLLLFDLIKLVATAMIKCIDKQLVDFLPGGKFHDVLNENDVRCTKFAHTTKTLNIFVIMSNTVNLKRIFSRPVTVLTE